MDKREKASELTVIIYLYMPGPVLSILNTAIIFHPLTALYCDNPKEALSLSQVTKKVSVD